MYSLGCCPLEYINTRATNAMYWCNHATTIPWLSILQRKPHGYIAWRHLSNVHMVSLSRALCHQVSINRVTYTYKYTFIYNSFKWIFSTITSRMPCDACDCRVPDTQISLSKVTLQNLLVRKYTLTPHTHKLATTKLTHQLLVLSSRTGRFHRTAGSIFDP